MPIDHPAPRPKGRQKHRKSISMSLVAYVRISRFCAARDLSRAGWLEKLAMDAIDDAEEAEEHPERL